MDIFGALDEIVRDKLNQQLLELWNRTGKTVGFVTHSIPEAVFLSTKIVVMSPRRADHRYDQPISRDRTPMSRDAGFLEIAHRVREASGRAFPMMIEAYFSPRPQGQGKVWEILH
jgi:NitT/TauT family transport system ATP-binding protein